MFDRLVKTLLGEDESYIHFIEATAARDTRRALDTIAAFMISGHTNIEAVLRDIRKPKPQGFPIPFHEFLNAIILRDHEYYTESDCDILNIFNISGSTDASNFNRIAVLGRILQVKNRKSDVGNGYVLIEEVVNDCNAAGILPETTISLLTLMNSSRLIETETTIKEEISSSRYVRATASGGYYIEVMAKLFGYLELILFETPIGNEKYFKKLKKAYGEVNALVGSSSQIRLKRVKARLELTQVFIDYLYAEFQKCSFRAQSEKFSSESRNLLTDVKNSFLIEKAKVIANAERVFSS